MSLINYNRLGSNILLELFGSLGVAPAAREADPSMK
jgi:hypothetical protein